MFKDNFLWKMKRRDLLWKLKRCDYNYPDILTKGIGKRNHLHGVAIRI